MAYREDGTFYCPCCERAERWYWNGFRRGGYVIAVVCAFLMFAVLQWGNV